MSSQTHSIPSGRARGTSAMNWANVATIVAVIGLLTLGLLGANVEYIALVALVVLGSLLILTDKAIAAPPHPPVV
ncbi:MAG TPA: hypothetical protein VLX44_20920 [Xanthobacteraceae bacterium]|nr:hypothetical protein [Xanthobacteraceae bacterium]